VEGTELSADVTKYVTKCTCEQTVDMADKITLTVLNVQEDVLGSGYTGFFAFTDSKVFQPGNTILVHMGYGAEEKLVGAGIIQRFLPNFPEDGPAMLTIMAYDASVLMMEGEACRQGEVWEDTAHSDVVLSVANRYAFIANIESSESIEGAATGGFVRVGIEKNTTKKKGMTDWELVQGLARLHGYDVKVRWSEDLNTWELWWGPDIWDQQKQYTFVYNQGQQSTLLSFQPEMAITGLPSTVKVLYFDQDTRTWEEMELKEEEGEGESIKFTGSGLLEDEIINSSSYRIAASGINVEVVPGIHFDSAEDAQLYAESFFRARKDQFITGRGKTAGLEVLKAGHTHILVGLGVQLGGEWYFTTVRHVFDAMSGYVCEFYANKVVT